MVSIPTTSLTFNSSTFCPHSVFISFVWISEQTAIISLYNLNWIVFITETESVYFAVRTGSLNQTDAVQYLKSSLRLINTFSAAPYKALLMQYLILMAVKLETVSFCVTTYSMQEIKGFFLSAISVTTQTQDIGTDIQNHIYLHSNKSRNGYKFRYRKCHKPF